MSSYLLPRCSSAREAVQQGVVGVWRGGMSPIEFESYYLTKVCVCMCVYMCACTCICMLMSLA